MAIRIMGADTDLIHVLHHNTAVKFFEQQLEKEFSMENIEVKNIYLVLYMNYV
jgi:hypothetical protein